MHDFCLWIYCNLSFVYWQYKSTLELDALISDKTTYFHPKLGRRVQIVTESTEETVKVCDFRPLSIPYLDDRGKPSDSRVYSNLQLSIITENRLRATLDKVLRGISHLNRPFEVNESMLSLNFSSTVRTHRKAIFYQSCKFVFYRTVHRFVNYKFFQWIISCFCVGTTLMQFCYSPWLHRRLVFLRE